MLSSASVYIFIALVTLSCLVYQKKAYIMPRCWNDLVRCISFEDLDVAQARDVNWLARKWSALVGPFYCTPWQKQRNIWITFFASLWLLPSCLIDTRTSGIWSESSSSICLFAEGKKCSYSLLGMHYFVGLSMSRNIVFKGLGMDPSEVLVLARFQVSFRTSISKIVLST